MRSALISLTCATVLAAFVLTVPPVRAGDADEFLPYRIVTRPMVAAPRKPEPEAAPTPTATAAATQAATENVATNAGDPLAQDSTAAPAATASAAATEKTEEAAPEVAAPLPQEPVSAPIVAVSAAVPAAAVPAASAAEKTAPDTAEPVVTAPRRTPGAQKVQRQVPPALPPATDVPTVPTVPPKAAREVRPEELARPAAVQPGTRSLTLDVNKSQIIRLSRPARDVLVANPSVADIVLRSADTAFIIGRHVGETNVFFFDAEGRQIDALDLTVAFDSGAVHAVLRRMIPNEEIDVATANQTLILTGSVASPQVAENARQIARQFVADDATIINLINIRDKNQVLLRVRVSEMSRQVVKELGITPGVPQANFSIGGSQFKLTGNPPNFTNTAMAALTGSFPLGAAGNLTALLQALESNGLVKTLAEPNMTAVSGETASFLVGGQFPVPTPQPGGTGGGTIITITYKDFGVRLTFTPVVLSGSLINLKIATEVSQLSNQGQVQVSGFSIPALSMRRAETTVELPSGGSIAIAGLLQNDIQNTIQGLPGLKDIPVLGNLFSSTEFQRRETDLVIAVTPLLVRPVDPNVLALPTDGFGAPSDFNLYLMKRLSAQYTKPTADAPHGRPVSSFGYIVE